MARTLAYEIAPDGSIVNVQVDGKPLAEATQGELVETIAWLIGRGETIQRRLGSPGYERRTWREKPPEERAPGAQMHDTGGVR